MKIKIEADFPGLNAKQTLAAVSNAVKQKEAAELMEAFEAGQDFKMESASGYVRLTKE